MIQSLSEVCARIVTKTSKSAAPQLPLSDAVKDDNESSHSPEIRLAHEDPFDDCFEFLDDIHGEIHVNHLERDAIDTPEFQRLFRLSQLGFVDLVYPTANHTRGAHSIGVCFWAKKLVGRLNKNNARFRGVHNEPKPTITRAEQVLISLAALLHDLPHGPFSHDIEKKTHYLYLNGPEAPPKKVKSHYGLYDKHDNFDSNPALHFYLLNDEQSVLARVLRHYSPAFVDLLRTEGTECAHLKNFIEQLDETDWPDLKNELLPQLLFHVLIYEKPEEIDDTSRKMRKSFDSKPPTEWWVGPKTFPKESQALLHKLWYQPFRHDIIGDTLSADLLDYLMRDQSRLGMKNSLDLKLLDYYILVPEENGRFRCAIDLDDHKRGTFRAERLNDIFRLLDLRHQIHEKAVFHRVVQSAIAMLSRAGLILNDAKPTLERLYGLDLSSPSLAGDDHFLHLLATTDVEGTEGDGKVARLHQDLPCKLAERRVYRPLMVIPGDRITLLLREMGDFDSSLEHPLRELAAIVDSAFFSSFFLLISAYIEAFLRHAFDDEDELEEHINGHFNSDDGSIKHLERLVPRRVIFWTNPYKQLYKDPAIWVGAEGVTARLDLLQKDTKLSKALRSRVAVGLRDAETKNESLWKLYVFLSDGLFYTGILAKARYKHPCALNPDNHQAHLKVAQRIVVRALRAAWQYWTLRKKKFDLEILAKDEELEQVVGLFSSGRLAFNLGEQDIPELVSAVKVGQYVHGDDVSNCRDVRYKFDKKCDVRSVLARTTTDKERQEALQQIIRQLALDSLKSEELAELAGRLNQASDLSTFVQAVASRNRPSVERELKLLWRRELE
jgi:HD superfamily phosphohydrolase